MFDAAASLQHGFDTAQSRLNAAQDLVARAAVDGRSGGKAMAQIAQAALFNEALLSAVHARLSELKSVTR